jgi:hypothetical protein
MTSDVRNSPESLPPRQRSAVTNGRRLFVDGDGNSAWSRRYRDLIAGHVSDLGGADHLSEQRTCDRLRPYRSAVRFLRRADAEFYE